MQDKVRDAFATQGFTGLDTKPVHLRREQDGEQIVPKLWEIEVTGWAGMARPESGIRRIERCNACGFQTFTKCTHPEFLVDAEQWDGNDFFLVWPLPYFFITDRVASFIKAEGLTGVNLVQPHEISFSKLVKVFGPVPLRYRFSEERARLLGDPLDIY